MGRTPLQIPSFPQGEHFTNEQCSLGFPRDAFASQLLHSTEDRSTCEKHAKRVTCILNSPTLRPHRPAHHAHHEHRDVNMEMLNVLHLTYGKMKGNLNKKYVGSGWLGLHLLGLYNTAPARHICLVAMLARVRFPSLLSRHRGVPF